MAPPAAGGLRFSSILPFQTVHWYIGYIEMRKVAGWWDPECQPATSA